MTERQPEVFVTEREDGTVLYCRRQGRGPGLLLIHGVACDSDYFEDTAGFLAGKYTVITYDRRGYSRSRVGEFSEKTGKSTLFSLRTQAEDAAAVIRAAGQRSVFAVGCSAGGAAAAELAALHPELVNGLFLHESFFRGVSAVKDEMESLYGKLRAAREENRVIRAMRAFIDSMGGADSRGKSKSLERQARDLENLNLFIHYEMESFFRSDLTLIKKLSMPVWIGVGECSREGLFHRAAREAAEKTGIPLIYVPGYHNLPADLPLEFAVAVSGVFDLMSGT